MQQAASMLSFLLAFTLYLTIVNKVDIDAMYVLLFIIICIF